MAKRQKKLSCLVIREAIECLDSTQHFKIRKGQLLGQLTYWTGEKGVEQAAQGAITIFNYLGTCFRTVKDSLQLDNASNHCAFTHI